jgi:FkbM family methyltransferase
MTVAASLKNLLREPVKRIPPLYRQYNRWRGWRIHDADATVPFTAIGGDKGAHNYGAWVVPDGLLHAGSIVYSFGVGEDISFDLEVIERFGCQVFAFDPTPRAVQFVERLAPTPKFVFSQVGLADEDGAASFVEPRTTDASYGMSSGSSAEEGLVHEFPVNRLSTIMAKNGHSHIDLLKMDIEGFEYGVIDDMLDHGLLPACIILEFHHFQRKDPEATRRSVKRLEEAGYKRFWISELGAEYGFVRA